MERLRLRSATKDDAALLFAWRNDAMARANSFQQEPISWETHRAWFDRKLASPDCRIWILEKDRQPVAQIRYEARGECAEISFSVAAPFRGRGFGKLLLRLSARQACRELSVRRLVGVVKTTNQPSIRAFRDAGFSQAESLMRQGESALAFHWICASGRRG